MNFIKLKIKLPMITARGSPCLTSSPGLTNNFSKTPGIGEIMHELPSVMVSFSSKRYFGFMKSNFVLPFLEKNKNIGNIHKNFLRIQYLLNILPLQITLHFLHQLLY